MRTTQFTVTLDSGTYEVAAEVYMAPRYSRECDDKNEVTSLTILKGKAKVDCDYIASQESIYRASKVDGDVIWGELSDRAMESVYNGMWVKA